jgi:lysophospholipase L1-like esterase
MKIILIIIAVLTSAIAILEIGLRLTIGLGNPPLYIRDNEIGYLLAPNQKIRRFGNQIEINQYSMRNKAIAPEKADGTLRILLLGDSIINGGWWTDQTKTISALIQQQLQQTCDRPVEVLNASANSWSPRSELAYLKRFGTFEADLIILVINTDDLFATAPTSILVGKDPNYRDRKPPLAIVELYQYYFGKSQSMPELEAMKQEKDRVGVNLQAIQQIKNLAITDKIEFMLTMTPLLRELETTSRDYELKARKRLKQFTDIEQISYIDFLSVLKDFPQPEFLYRDHIHLSPQGNHLVSETLSKSIQERLSFCKSSQLNQKSLKNG